MKRFSQGGDSPGPKHLFVIDNDSDPSSEEIVYCDLQFSSTPSKDLEPGMNFQFSQAPTSSQQPFRNFLDPSPASQTSSNPDNSQTPLNLLDNSSLNTSQDGSNQVLCSQNCRIMPDRTPQDNSTTRFKHKSSDTDESSDWQGYDFDSSSSSSDDADEKLPFDDFEGLLVDDPETTFEAALAQFVTKAGAAKVAAKILENEDLKNEIAQQIFKESHKSLKDSLKTSKLVACKKDRGFLLTVTPRLLCEELQEKSDPTFQLLIKGLLGISNQEEIFDSQFLLNNISLLYSTIGKILNRNAIGYALLLTTMARDGGLREDSIKLFSIMTHPRTSQKYDKDVLAVGWDTQLKDSLKKEQDHFHKLKEAESKHEKLLQDGATDEAVEAAKDNLEVLLDIFSPQLQLVWDNLNLRTKHRHQRVNDDYADSNFDWMASLWIQDRIDSHHMDHREGVALKEVENLSIKDMIPSDEEKDYVFIALIHYFSSRLVHRHPNLFKSIAKSIKPNRPHQFQQAMNAKSEESTGQLFTKSESCTEDLIDMMAEVQIHVNTFEDNDGVKHCHEKKIVSGDQKTEKNMHYGILRLQCNIIFK